MEKRRVRILAVVGDIGGAKELLPALDLLEAERDVTLMADTAGAAKDMLEKAGRPWVAFDPTSGELPFCDVLAVGTSATASEAQVALTRAARREGVPVVWVEDLYGCGSRVPVREPAGIAPDLFCVIDGIAAEIVRRSWPGVPITVCGKPSWGFLADLVARRAELRSEVRAQLGLAPGAVLLTCWHGGENPADERLTLETIGMFRNVPRLRLAMRLHPKMQADALAAMRADLAAWGAVCVDAGGVQAERLSIASDMVVASWGSTQGYVAVLAGVPTVVTAFGDAPEQMRDLYYPDGLPPHVFVGAARIVLDGSRLGNAIGDMLAAREAAAEMARAQAEPLRAALDAHAAEKIAAAIVGAAR